MNSQTVEITSAGIRKILNKYTPERAIAEYVWNGFDSSAVENPAYWRIVHGRNGDQVIFFNGLYHFVYRGIYMDGYRFFPHHVLHFGLLGCGSSFGWFL